jgi:hypothetical protein
MKTITVTEAITALRAGVSTDGYTLREELEPIETRIRAALKKHSVFAARADWQLDVVVVDGKNYCFIYSVKDESYFRADYELDNNEDVRIIRITPLKGETPVREQLAQRAVAGLLTEEDLPKLKALNEQSEKAASAKWERDKLVHRRAAGLITEEQYNQQREQLLLEQHKQTATKPLVEADDDGPTKRQKIWAAQRAGQLTIEQAAEQAAEIRIAEERGGRRLLTEQQQCDDDCDCRDCHIENFKDLLESRVAAGTMTREQADRCYAGRCEMD